MKSKTLLHSGLLLLIAWSLYADSLWGGFVYDDVSVTVLENPALSGDTSLGEVMTWDRPLRELTYIMDHAWWGYNPIGYHLQNVFWHSANGILLYFFFTFLGWESSPAFCLAFLFLIHPIQTESVAWISGRKELLCLFFEISACWLFVYSLLKHPKPRKNTILSFLGAVLAFFLASLSKQVAVVLPFFMMLSYWIYAMKHQKTFRFFNILVALIPFFLVWLGFLFFSYRLVGELQAVGERGAFYDPASRDIAYTLLSAILTPGATLLHSLQLWVLPLDLTVEPAFNPVVSWWDWRWMGGAAVFAIGSLLSYKTRKTEPFIAFGWLWFLIAWSPVSGAVPVGYLFADRYLYIPSVGIGAALIGGFSFLSKRLLWKSVKFNYLTYSVMLGLFTLFFVGRTVVRIGDWRSEITLWESAVHSRPDNAKARFNLANAYRDAQRIEDAMREWQEALKLQPNYPQVWVNMGNTQRQQNHLTEAESCYLKALELEPSYGTAQLNLAQLYEDQHKIDLALEHYQLAAKQLFGKRNLNRRKAIAHYHIAKILYQRQDQEMALLHLRQAEKLAPRYAPIYVLQGLLSQNNPEAARRAFETAVEIDPNYAEAYYDLGVLEWQWGNHTVAECYWKIAEQLNPGLASSIANVKKSIR